MKLAVVLGSIREGRKGEAVAKWVKEQVEDAEISKENDITWEFLDVKAFNLPFLTAETVPGAAKRQYDSEEVRAWSKAIDECDGFLWVTAEYNHSIPGAFKNAHDLLGPEWWGKAVAFVGYGADAGVRAVEHWRGICANVGMQAVRPQVALSTFFDWQDGAFAPLDRRPQELNTVLAQLVDITGRHLDNRR